MTTSTTFAAEDIYTAAINWSVLEANMQYLLPMDYISPDFRLLNGWKLDADGYESGTVLTVTGSLATDDNSTRVNTGTVVQWELNKAIYTIMVATGSGVTAQDKIDIADEIMTRGLLGEDNFLALK